MGGQSWLGKGWRFKKGYKWKLWCGLAVALGSQSEGRGFDPLPMLDGNGVKATPESIPTPDSGSI